MGQPYPLMSRLQGFRSSLRENVLPYAPVRAESLLLGSHFEEALPARGHQTPSLISEIASLLRRLQERGLRVPTAGAVYEYLASFPELIGVVEQVVNTVQGRLSDAQLSLDLYHDVEFEDSYLVLYVRFVRYDEDTIHKLDSVEDECLNLLGGKGGFLITTDFRPPE